jgi:hypothetical protein
MNGRDGSVGATPDLLIDRPAGLVIPPCHIALPFHQVVMDLRCIALETERPAT